MDAPAGHDRNADQIAYWNGPGGQKWADRQAAQDVVLGPVADVVLDRAAARSGERIVDVGCGSGALSIALARYIDPTGRVLGVDVSAPMLAQARRTAPSDLPIDFVQADATVYPFDAEAFDMIASRFGVMFFADPVLSFTNIRKALKRSGRLVFACWREPRANPFFMTPLQAVYRHVPKLPVMGPDDPGPFSFAAEERVKRILSAAGFGDISMEPCDLALDIAVGRGLDTAIQSALEIGPASRALDGHPDDVRAAAAESVRSALEGYVQGERVLLPAAIWIVAARPG